MYQATLRRHVESTVVAPNKAQIARWNTSTDGTTKTLSVYEHVLHISIGAGDSGTLTLPDVAEAAGHTYTIRLLDDGTGNDKQINISIPGSAPVINPNGTISTSINSLTADDDLIVLYSDGYYWHLTIDVTT